METFFNQKREKIKKESQTMLVAGWLFGAPAEEVLSESEFLIPIWANYFLFFFLDDFFAMLIRCTAHLNMFVLFFESKMGKRLLFI